MAKQNWANTTTEQLIAGKKVQIKGFGTFSCCSRKATAERPACTIAMFRASSELRDYIAGGELPQLISPELTALVTQLKQDGAVSVPGFGEFQVVTDNKNVCKITFAGASGLNSQLD